jgi:putative DNA primase/helicase
MVPYGLPNMIKDMLADRSIGMCFVEGEAKADLLRRLTFPATSIQEGCERFGAYVAGAPCFIFVDKDEAGEKRAQHVAEGLREHASGVFRNDLPGLPEGGDILDWYAERKAAGRSDKEIIDEINGLENRPWVFGPKSAPAPAGRPVIVCEAGAIHKSATEAEAALLGAGVAFYRRGSGLYMPVVEEVDALRGGKTMVAQLKAIDAPCMNDHLCRVAEFQRWDGRARDYVVCNPPAHVAKTVLSRFGEWRFAKIAGVVTMPIMRRDGSVKLDAGYDVETKLLVMSPPEIPALPERPSRNDGMAALAELNGLLSGFPFVDGPSRSVALSGLITPVVRSAMTVAPLHGISAPAPGTGKSYLVELAYGIATGQAPPSMPAGRTEEETEKRLAAAIVSGRSIISIDNLNGELGGDLFCQLVERPVVSIRILGETRLVDVECSATVFANGNQLTPAADIVRRTLMCSMDADMQNPELRVFASNPLKEIIANRARYIWAALTVVRAFLVAGSPLAPPPLASYDEWSALVRAPLMWLGCDDPVLTQETARKNDPQMLSFAAIMGELVELLTPGVSMTVGEIRAAADEQVFKAGVGYSPARPRLRQVLVELAGTRGEIDMYKLSRKILPRFNGRVMDGKKLVGEPDGHRKQTVWRVVSVAGVRGSNLNGT